MNQPGLSVIILTKNAGDLFPEVLEAVLACHGIDEAEVLVIDSGSVDKTIEYCRSYEKIHLIEILAAEFGHGRTRNLGAQFTDREILLYLVQDATPASPDFFKRLIEPLADPQIAAVYGRQLPRANANPVERFFLQSTYPESRRIRGHTGSGPLNINSIFFSNVCSAIRRSIWQKFPFDEKLIMSEDQQWAKQVLKAGYRIVYEPDAAVYHSHNYGLKSVFRRNFDSGFSLQGIIQDSRKEMMVYEFGYLLTGVKQLAKWGEGSWIPYFFLHEAVRSLGFALGKGLHFLPKRLKRAFSLHKYYWNGKFSARKEP